MFRSKTILFLGSDRHSELAEKLYDQGFILLFRDTILAALDTLRHDNFGAVFIDCQHLKGDVLEFILNVRDLDSQIPIFVVGKPHNKFENQAILQQENTHLLMPRSERFTRMVHLLS